METRWRESIDSRLRIELPHDDAYLSRLNVPHLSVNDLVDVRSAGLAPKQVENGMFPSPPEGNHLSCEVEER